jgi:hypothetical protein
VRFIDVSGAPGTGKSALCDELWPPRCIEYDGLGYPGEWSRFLRCVDGLLAKIRKHPSYRAAESMTTRSFRKMATVSRIQSDKIYIQTGFAQRGLGIGWRLDNPADIAEYFELMPVSLGVVFVTRAVKENPRRNVARGKDRSHMVPLMVEPQRIAIDVLKSRGVSVVELSTMKPIQETKAELAEFVSYISRHEA